MEIHQEVQVRGCSRVERCPDRVDHTTVLLLAVAAMCGLSSGGLQSKNETRYGEGEDFGRKSCGWLW